VHLEPAPLLGVGDAIAELRVALAALQERDERRVDPLDVYPAILHGRRGGGDLTGYIGDIGIPPPHPSGDFAGRFDWAIECKTAEIDLANWFDDCYTLSITARSVAVIGD